MAFCGPNGEPIHINGSSPDVSSRPETSSITSVQFAPTDFYVRHTAEAWWPEPIPPGWDGGIQWTLWIVINVDGQWYSCGSIEFWKDPDLGVYRGDSPAPFSTGKANWWYHASPQNTKQPGPGEQIGVFVCTAGSQRMKDVTDPSCIERSNIVWLQVPQNDTGMFTFSVPEPEPEPIPPSPSGITLDDVMATLAKLETQQAQDTEEIIAHTTAEADRVIQRLNELRQEVIDFAEIAGKAILLWHHRQKEPDETEPEA